MTKTKLIIIMLIAVTLLTACTTKEHQNSNSASMPQTAVCTQSASLQGKEQIKHAQTTKTETVTSSNIPKAQKEPLPPNKSSQPAATSKPQQPVESALQTTATQRPLLEMELEAVRLVNLERQKAGLAALKTDDTYYNLVKLRTEECVQYWSHTRPNGKDWSSVYNEQDVGKNIRKIGENLGKSFQTVEQITTALMNSETHRSTILDPDYTHVCIAITIMEQNQETNKTLYAITQHFYKKED